MNHKKAQDSSSLALAALGVVYGDIGTSPLYALRASLHGLPLDALNIFGALSLIFWSLIVIVTLKYVIILLRADNNGEGGILSLLTLIKRSGFKQAKFLLFIAICGAGLILGDGMLTPSISILSAVEGLNVIFPHLGRAPILITCIILFILFYVQAHGTAKIGYFFGPILFIWFLIIACLGAIQIIHNPVVLEAINPYFAYEFFIHNGWNGYALLGGVFLVVTGGEALYADLGHFGRAPIQWAWFLVVLPSLLLNYFGQGALLLNNPAALHNPFYALAPAWFMYPLLVIATMATVIASQAVITATFSITKQAILLGFYPHLAIVQTSTCQAGQIFIPHMNRVLLIGTIFLVVMFKNSNALTSAYGIAVNLVMLLTSILMSRLVASKRSWKLLFLEGIFFIVIAIEIGFLGANLQKINHGGWVPILFAAACASVMYTWCEGRKYLHKTYYIKKKQLEKLLRQMSYRGMHHVPGMIAICITDIYDKCGGNFLQFLKMNRFLPEHIVMISYVVHNVPYITEQKRAQVKLLRNNVYKLTLHYGFMDMPSVPDALELVNARQMLPFYINIPHAIYFIEITNVVAARERKTMVFRWQERLFAFLARNYSVNLDIDFYQLPYARTIAIGAYHVI